MNTKEFENKRWSTFTQRLEFRHSAALKNITEGTVVDIGCGDGLLLELLKKKGITAKGFDVSEKAVEVCLAKGLNAELFDGTNLPIKDGSFNTAVSLDVLEHTFAPEVLIKEMQRISSGKVIIGVPNFSSLPARIQVLFGRVPENNTPGKGHIYWFTLDVLKKLTKDSGLQLIRLEGNNFWQKIPVLGSLIRMCAKIFPGLFLLSFIGIFEIKK